MGFSIELKNISKSFNKKPIIKNSNYKFKSNNIYLLKAESGTGKTTLLKLIYKDLKLTSGNIEYTNLKKEDILLDLNDEVVFSKMTVLDNLKIVSENESLIENLLKELKIDKLKYTKTSLLSTGQKARVSIARILLLNKKVLLLDEPTANLDQENKNIFINMLNKYGKDKLIIIVTHDLSNDDWNNITLKNFNLIELFKQDIKSTSLLNEKGLEKLKPSYFFKFIREVLIDNYIYEIGLLIFMILFSLSALIFANICDYTKIMNNYLNDNDVSYVYSKTETEYGYGEFTYDYNGTNIDCLYSINNNFTLFGNTYSLNNDDIYVSTTLGIDADNYITIPDGYSLISNSYVEDYLLSEGFYISSSDLEDVYSILKEKGYDDEYANLDVNYKEDISDSEISIYTGDISIYNILNSLNNTSISSDSILYNYISTASFNVYYDETYGSGSYLNLYISSDVFDSIVTNISNYHNIEENNFVFSEDSFSKLNFLSLNYTQSDVSLLQYAKNVKSNYYIFSISFIVASILFILYLFFYFKIVYKKNKNDIKLLNYTFNNDKKSIFINSFSLFISFILETLIIFIFNNKMINSSLFNNSNSSFLLGTYSNLNIAIFFISILIFLFIIFLINLIYYKNTIKNDV